MRVVTNPHVRRHRGLASIEVQVGFAMFGVALAGLFPVVYAQLRVTNRIESRTVAAVPPGCAFDPVSGIATTRLTNVDRWARRLGLGPTIVAWEWQAEAGHSADSAQAPTDPTDHERDIGLMKAVAVSRDAQSGQARSLVATVAPLSGP